jgi:GNAT superfamily N-acetyltransferase
MPIIVQPILETDGEEWARVYYQAFKSVVGYLFISEPSEESYKQMAISNISTLKDSGTHVFKAVDTDTNRIAGIAQWQIFKEPPSEDYLNSSIAELSETPEVDGEKRRALLEGITKSRNEIMSLEPCVLLRIFMVHPDYQRRGVGTQLLQWGIEQMDQ